MTYIIIYLIGYVLAYYAFRYIFKEYGITYTWKDVFFNLKWAFLSYISLLIIIIIHLHDKINSSTFFNKKPPKWL